MKRRRFFESLTAALLAVLMIVAGFALAQPPEGKGGGKNKDDGGGDDGGTTDPLPPVRYRISYPTPPVDQTGGVFINGMNNLGQVVGWYLNDVGPQAFIYDLSWGMIGLDALVTGGLPEGWEDWRLRSGVAINDWMVVVGRLELTGSEPLQRGLSHST